MRELLGVWLWHPAQPAYCPNRPRTPTCTPTPLLSPVFEERIQDFDEGARLGFIEGLPSVQGLCTADVLLAEFVHGLLPMVPDALDNYPRIAALHQQIIAMPSVAAYLASDKRFPFPTEGEICDAYVANVNKVLHGR